MSLDVGEVYAQHRGTVYRYVLARCGRSPAVAEDITQDTFARALAHRGRYVDQGRPLAWLYTIARHLLADHWKKAAHRYEVAAGLAGAAGEPEAGTATLEERYCAALQLRTYRAALRQAARALTDVQRQALHLFYVEGKTAAAIAAELEIDETVVKARLYRARQRLRDDPGLRAVAEAGRPR